MNTTENNKLIAEFMGWKLQDNPTERWYGSYKEQNGILHKNTNKEPLLFHTSWDWLMPVVDKIERQHKANFRIKCIWNEFNECSYYQVIVNIEQGEMSKDRSCIYDSKKVYDYIGDTSKCKVSATYKAVVEFIKWYNKNK